jgi:sarcosine oxidase gamma subunit
MFDRSGFWSTAPDWRQTVYSTARLRLAAAVMPTVWRLSGFGSRTVLAELGVRHVLGPRDACDATDYALRLAPDSVLLICDPAACAALRDLGERPRLVVSELSDGFVGMDITGSAAPLVLQLANEYPFMDLTDRPDESARMTFAGLPVVVMRRHDGWRLHVERPWAAALWRWLMRHVQYVEEDGQT